MNLLTPSPEVIRARKNWRYRGVTRPPFATAPADGQLSVWDFPRPPRIEPVGELLRVEDNGRLIAATTSGFRVLETAGAPTYYFREADVATSLVWRTGMTFHCEWKGVSEEISTAGVRRAGWVLTDAYPEFGSLQGYYAFYPHSLACFVGDLRARPQPGNYYGGWVTPDLVGPIKGEPGSESW